MIRRGKLEKLVVKRYLLTAVCMLCALAFLCERSHAQDTNPATGVTIQQPVVGVSIDANGVMTAREFRDVDNRMAANLAGARRNLSAKIQQRSALRKISLKRLEAAVKTKLAAGDSISQEMHVLAGLLKIQYIFVVPADNDMVIAGPAEGWVDDLAGRKVGLTSGMPTLLLEDLLVAMRTFSPNANLNTWVAVSIDPTADGLENLNEFQKKIPSRIPMNARERVMHQLAEGLRDSLGLAKIAIYGVPRQSHLAQVMVEADYRMKLMAVGMEIKPIEITTFIDALQGAPRHMQRWWLTPDYQCLKVAADGLSVEMIGRTVKLKTESIDFDRNARIVRSKTKPSRAANVYARSFTDNYERLSRVRPIYAQLRNVVDVLVAAAWMKKNNAFQKSGWIPTLFFDNDQLDVEYYPDAKTAPCVANAVWKGNLLIAPSGGGVSITASHALEDKNLLVDKKKSVQAARDQLAIPDDQWWWD